MTVKSDDWYVGAFRKGGRLKEEATRYFMQEHIGLIHQMRVKFKLDESQITDLFTDALIGLIFQVEMGKFQGESKLSTYFYRIFYHKCVDHLRKNTTNTIELTQEIVNQTPEETSYLDQWMEKLEVAELKKWMSELGDKCQQILMDWGFWGYNMAEIATRNGYDNSDQVKKRKYKCLQQLRKLLQTKSSIES